MLFKLDAKLIISTVLLYLLLLLYIPIISSQHVKKEDHTCPYLWLKWKQRRTLGWICGSVPFLKTNVPGVEFEYDCCPGYEKTELLDNKCAFVDQIDYISDSDAVGTLVSSGRWYSKEFRNGQKIPTTKGTSIKVTTYSTGLIFLDCKVLLSPDHEASNGLIHHIDGALPPTYKYPTVLKRLNAEPDLSAFVQSLPNDLKKKLDEPDSNVWYTVFAVPNNVWNRMISGITSPEAKEALVREHVMEKMICSDAIVQNSKRVGPTLSETHISIQRKSDGNLVLTDVCNNKYLFNPNKQFRSMNLNEALECLKNNPSLNVRQSASEMLKCQMNIGQGSDNVVLLPNDGAFQSKFYKENSRQIQSEKCKVFAHHLLKPSDARNVDVRKTGFNQEQEFTTQYTASDSSKHSVFSRYIKTRHGTTLAFNHAEVTEIHGMKFRDGIIYVVKQVNLPPQGDILSVIKQNPKAKEISAKLSATNFRKEFTQHAPNVLFLAPIDLGWKTRDLENGYTEEQTYKLLQLHTIPHEFFGGDDGFIERGSVLEVESLLSSDSQGNKVKLLIKRTPDGNTFIGHKDLQETYWSMVLDWNRIGEDGIVWFIDWPMRCPERLC
ncbi:unnamed protein product [Heterobilharzia americana]|nr:unnamed protein product [Heterobilharzia americana]